jgi:hypothetical protein
MAGKNDTKIFQNNAYMLHFNTFISFFLLEVKVFIKCGCSMFPLRNFLKFCRRCVKVRYFLDHKMTIKAIFALLYCPDRRYPKCK